MTIGSRVKEERERLKLSQTVFGEIGGVLKGTQINYEKGERSPDANYLASVSKIGVDVYYILTGERKQPPSVVLTSEEQVILNAYRKLSEAEQKQLMVLALTGIDINKDKKAKKAKFAGVQVIGDGISFGNIAGRDIVHGDIKKK